MAENDNNGAGTNFGYTPEDLLKRCLVSGARFLNELAEKNQMLNDPSLYDGFYSLVEKDRQRMEDPESVYLTRAWLLKHGWVQATTIPLFHGDMEHIDADLCVIVDRKDYIVANFHYMGGKAFEPSAMPYSFEVVGVNNSMEMLDYDHTRLVMAAYVCHLTGFEEIDKAIGGVYEMTMNKKE